ncbi:MAG: hypothetical protein Kow0099_04570 [Candidatus Abyssubacteria bacterium]
MEAIITLIVLWVAWKILQSVIEEVQTRAERRKLEEAQAQRAAARTRLPTRSAPPSREPEARQAGPPETVMEAMERLYRDALERKRQLERTTAPHPAPPIPELPHTETGRRAEPPPWPPAPPPRRKTVRVEQRRVVRPQRPAAPQKPPAQITNPYERQHAVHAKTPQPFGETLIGRLGPNELRKGILLAEILGPPKALRASDSYEV